GGNPAASLSTLFWPSPSRVRPATDRYRSQSGAVRRRGSEPWNEVAPGLDPDGRSGEITSDRLPPAAEMRGQECLRDRGESHAVFRSLEAVPLVRKRKVGDGNAAGLERGHHLLGLRGHHADIAHALGDQDRLGRPFEVIDRGALAQECAAL